MKPYNLMRTFLIQLTLFVSNIDNSNYLSQTKQGNYQLVKFTIFSLHLHSYYLKLLLSQTEISGLFEIMRVNCI